VPYLDWKIIVRTFSLLVYIILIVLMNAKVFAGPLHTSCEADYSWDRNKTYD